MERSYPRMNIKIVVLIISLLFGFLYPAYAGIGIDPMQVEIQVEKGIETRGICRIFNTGEKSINIKVRLEDWLKQGFEPSTWVKIGPASFTIEPGKFNEVEYVVTAPIDSTGELMAMVFFGGLEEGSNVGAEFGIPIYASIKGTEIVDAEIIKIVINYDKELGLTGSVNIKNKGNVHIRPYTTIHVLNNLGKSVVYFGVPYGLPVHVGKERRFDFSKKDIKLEAGSYKVIAETKYGQLYETEKKATKEIELVVRQ